ncbi:MAG: DJ-1/PfpI family protein [Clostridia bacterium]|nr:DJ-1/PfpI family protein [Clostridia bacterium]
MIYLLLAAGFEECEALVPADLLRRAGLVVKTVAITAGPVTGSHGITVQADIPASEANEPIDLLILPGGMPGTKNLDDSPHVDKLIERTMAESGHIAAICAAPMILGKRGLLRGKEAVCYPGFERYLEGAQLSDRRVVTDGNISTAVGMGAAGEFGLELVSILTSREEANELAKAAMLPPLA